MRVRTLAVIVAATGTAIVCAAMTNALAADHEVKQNVGHYAVRCFRRGELEKGLNDAFKSQGWKLVEMAPSKCLFSVAGKDSLMDAFTVVLAK